MTTKDFLNGIRRRIAQGESKKDIYNQYTMTEWESCVTRFLPTQVSLRSRKKWGWLNNILLACLALITVFKVLDVFFLTSAIVFAFNMYLSDWLRHEGKVIKMVAFLRLRNI